MREPLFLEGLDGGNPLAFMALLGVAQMCRYFSPHNRISWVHADGSWRPMVHGFDGVEDDFLQKILSAVAACSSQPFSTGTCDCSFSGLRCGVAACPSQPFSIDKKLPFKQKDLHEAMNQSCCGSAPILRRAVDLLAGFGSDAFVDKEGAFSDTSFRMVRSGDANGQGLPAYAQAIRSDLTVAHLRATLFDVWRYEDDTFSLRWDPVEDQRYALRWHDPSLQSSKKYGLRTMRGANALALEGLALLPVQPQVHGVATTGFAKLERGREFFTWPIWEVPVAIDVIRSLLTLPELKAAAPNRETLRAIGIAEIYRSEKVAPNKYYKNFTPARPV